MSETNRLAPLWSLCSFDDDLLPDSTSSEFSFNYVDISNVKTGRMEIPHQIFTIANAPSRARRLAQPGDVVVSTVRTYLRAIAPVPTSTDSLVFSTGFCVVRPHAGISDGRFINYLLTSGQVVDEIVADSTGTSYPATSATKIARLRVPSPPMATQRAIADYLDRETAEIDGMRADLDEMERLLTERRSALLQRLIDQRIDDHATPMSIAVSGHLGGSGLVGGQLSAEDGDTGILKTSAISSGSFLPAQNRLVEVEQAESVPGEYFVQPGDLLFNRLNSPEYVGSMSYVDEIDSRLIFSDKIWRLLPGPQTDPKYLALWSRTPAYRKQVDFSIVGTSHSMQSLGYSTFQQFRIFLPPLTEQRRIADEIDHETAEIDSMLEDIKELRDLLTERRAAVISAAVTGQIDIPVSSTAKDEPHA